MHNTWVDQFRQIKQRIKREIRVYRGIVQDKRTPRFSKFLLACALGYLFLPFDLIPDWIPIIGHLDDAIIIPLLIFIALHFIPVEIVEEHRRRNQE